MLHSCTSPNHPYTGALKANNAMCILWYLLPGVTCCHSTDKCKPSILNQWHETHNWWSRNIHIFEYSVTFPWELCLSWCQLGDCKVKTPVPRWPHRSFCVGLAKTSPMLSSCWLMSGWPVPGKRALRVYSLLVVVWTCILHCRGHTSCCAPMQALLTLQRPPQQQNLAFII